MVEELTQNKKKQKERYQQKIETICSVIKEKEHESQRDKKQFEKLKTNQRMRKKISRQQGKKTNE